MLSSSLSANTHLMVRNARGRYRPATTHQIFEAARQAIDQRAKCGQRFPSLEATEEYLHMKLAGLECEVFAVLFLDTQHRLLAYKEMFRGSIDSMSVYPREVVKEALRFNAAAVIVAHNHPGGSKLSSEADRKLTRVLKRALGLVDVRLLDHVLVADDAILSFLREGWL
jgi:DNA repair protein RadC